MGTSLADTSCSSVSPALLSTSSQGCNLDVDILSLLAARTGKIDPNHVEIFKKQVGCLNFPDDYHSYDGKTGQQLSKNLQRQSFNSHRVEILPCEMSYLSAIVFRSSLFLDQSIKYNAHGEEMRPPFSILLRETVTFCFSFSCRAVP